MKTIEQAIEASQKGDLATVKEYLSQHQEISPDLFHKVEALLAHAVNWNKFDIVEYLVKEGVHSKRPLNNSLVYLAWSKGHYKIWRLLANSCDPK